MIRNLSCVLCLILLTVPILAQKKAPSVILASSGRPSGKLMTVFVDAKYIFVSRNYGNQGNQTPGFFVYSRRKAKWKRIAKLSTQGAKFGRSPEAEEVGIGGLPSVSWNWTGYVKDEYVSLPLRTSGSISFPEKIKLDDSQRFYVMTIHEGWKIETVLTRFMVRISDIDQAFS